MSGKKKLGQVLIVLGFLILIGTVGNSDYKELTNIPLKSSNYSSFSEVIKLLISSFFLILGERLSRGK